MTVGVPLATKLMCRFSGNTMRLTPAAAVSKSAGNDAMVMVADLCTPRDETRFVRCFLTRLRASIFLSIHFSSRFCAAVSLLKYEMERAPDSSERLSMMSGVEVMLTKFCIQSHSVSPPAWPSAMSVVTVGRTNLFLAGDGAGEREGRSGSDFP